MRRSHLAAPRFPLARRAGFSLIASIAIASAPAAPSAIAGDWPTYQHDDARSGISKDPLPDDLTLVWRWQSRAAPRPAWSGPAKWDGWNRIRDLSNRMVFDRAFHVAIAGDRVYFGSSVDDKVYALDLRTGREVWRYYTEGPVRLAPSVHEDLVYFGSDDGSAYAVDAASGELRWRRRIAPEELRVAGNERVVSLWPVRTGVIVRDGIAYCGAGVFPWEGVYLVALDARSGEERWRRRLEELPAQGYLLASESRLYVTTGRERPVVFDRAEGKRLHQVEGGGGGTYALVTDDMLVYGPGKAGELSAYRAGQKDQIATFQGHHMIVTRDASYLLDDAKLTSLDRTRYIDLFTERRRRQGELERSEKLYSEAEKRNQTVERERIRPELDRLRAEIDRLTAELPACVRWSVPCRSPLALILAGDKLFAGGEGRVVAHDARTGSEIWRGDCEGGVYGLAAASECLLVSTDRGEILCFAAATEEPRATEARGEVEGAR